MKTEIQRFSLQNLAKSIILRLNITLLCAVMAVCLLCLNMAQARVCFVPTGACDDAIEYDELSAVCNGYNLPAPLSGGKYCQSYNAGATTTTYGWNCSKCTNRSGVHWKCEKAQIDTTYYNLSSSEDVSHGGWVCSHKCTGYTPKYHCEKVDCKPSHCRSNCGPRDVQPSKTCDASRGWKVENNGYYYGDEKCGKCVGVGHEGYNISEDQRNSTHKDEYGWSCESKWDEGIRYWKCTEVNRCGAGYDRTVTSCGNCYNFATSGYYGGKACGKCTIIASGATSTKPSVTNSDCHAFSSGSGTNGVTCYYNVSSPGKPSSSESQSCTEYENCYQYSSGSCSDTSWSYTVSATSCTDTSTTCGCGGKKTRSSTRYCSRSRGYGTYVGSHSRPGSQSRSRSVTCSSNGSGWSAGGWSGWSSCSGSGGWSGCSYSSCSYSDWSSCDYSCSYGEWGSCSKSDCSAGQECVNGSCVAKACTSNSQCSSGQYCYITGVSSDYCSITAGECREIGTVNSSYVSALGFTVYYRTSELGWYSADNWCKAQGKSLMSATVLNCYSLGSSTRATFGDSDIVGYCCQINKDCGTWLTGSYDNNTSQFKALKDFMVGFGWTGGIWFKERAIDNAGKCNSHEMYWHSSTSYGMSRIWRHPSDGEYVMCQ